MRITFRQTIAVFAMVAIVWLALHLIAGCSREVVRVDSPLPVVVDDPVPAETPVEVPPVPDEVVIPDPEPYRYQTVYFDYDSWFLTYESRDVLERNAEYLLNRSPGLFVTAHNLTIPDEILIEGHCDERGSTEYNLALGERRADAVRQFYVAYGVDVARIRVISYGEEQPVVVGHNEAAWRWNRRAETK